MIHKSVMATGKKNDCHEKAAAATATAAPGQKIQVFLEGKVTKISLLHLKIYMCVCVCVCVHSDTHISIQ